jgi:hypothetical protein
MALAAFAGRASTYEVGPWGDFMNETPEQHRERVLSIWRQTDDRHEKQTQLIAETGTAAIRMCFLLNGAGCIALLSFLGAAAGADQLTPRLEAFIARADENINWFAWGACAAVLAAAMMHFTTTAYSAALYAYDKIWQHPYLEDNFERKCWSAAALTLRLATILAVLSSIGLFVYAVARMQGLLS